MSAVLIHLSAVLLAVAVGAPGPATPPAEPEPQPKSAPPSLDELLGLRDAADNAAEQAARQNEQELQRRLSDVELGDAFEVALEKMQTSADLLDVERDSGLGTQRVQQDILVKLDELIDIAKQMSQKQKMSSGGGGPGEPRPQPGAEQRQQPGEGTRTSSGTQGGGAIDLPPGREGDINTIIEETDTEWGHLPERLREMLEQGRSSYISRLYRQLTEEYYKRLAEEGSS